MNQNRMLNYYPPNYTWRRLLIRIYISLHNLQKIDIMTGISQRELTHDNGHAPRASSVTSHVSCSLSFLGQRQINLSLVKHGINLSGVREKV